MTANEYTNTIEDSNRIITLSAKSLTEKRIQKLFIMESLRVSCFTTQLCTNDRSADFISLHRISVQNAISKLLSAVPASLLDIYPF